MANPNLDPDSEAAKVGQKFEKIVLTVSMQKLKINGEIRDVIALLPLENKIVPASEMATNPVVQSANGVLKR